MTEIRDFQVRELLRDVKNPALRRSHSSSIHGMEAFPRGTRFLLTGMPTRPTIQFLGRGIRYWSGDERIVQALLEHSVPANTHDFRSLYASITGKDPDEKDLEKALNFLLQHGAVNLHGEMRRTIREINNQTEGTT